MSKISVIVAISIPLAALSLAGQDFTEPTLSEPSVANPGIDSPSASGVANELAEPTNSAEPAPSADPAQTALGQEANRSVVKPLGLISALTATI